MYNPKPKSINPVNYLASREYNNSPNILKQAISARLNSAKHLYSKNLLAHYGCVNALEFSNGGELLASGGDDRRVLVWNIEEALQGTGQPSAMRAQHLSNIFCLGYDSKNTKIFSAGNDDQVIVHDTATGDPIDYFLHEQPVYNLSVDPFNDNVFASACDDGRILIYDIRESTNSDPFALAVSGAAFHGVMYNPSESRLIATANAKDGACLWDVRKPKHVLLRYGSAESCMSVRWDRRGVRLLALRRRLPPVLYPIHSSLYLAQFDHPSYYNSCTMKSCCFAGDNDQFVLSGSDDFNLYMWKVPEREPGAWESTAHIVLTGHRSIVNQVRFNPVNQIIVSSGVEKLIKVWSPFPLPNNNGNQADKSQRKVFSHEEYFSLVVTSGQFISHDYSHQSTKEDPRMMAFFDSLVQREIEGWTSGDSHTEPPSPLASDHILSHDSSSSSVSNNADEDGNDETKEKSKVKSTNPIVELIASKRAQLVRLAAQKRGASSDSNERGTVVNNRCKHSCKRRRWRPVSSSSDSDDKSTPQSLSSTPSEKRKKSLVWDDQNSSDITDIDGSSNGNAKEPSTSSETPDSGISLATSTSIKQKNRSHRNYRRRLPDTDSD